MQVAADRTDASTAIQTDLPAIFASLELSRSTWLITSLSPGAGEKMSKHSIRAGDVAGLLVRLAQLKEKARGRTGRGSPHHRHPRGRIGRLLDPPRSAERRIESHVVDAASILTSAAGAERRPTGSMGETLVRTLLAYKRGEPRVCAMVKAPTPEEEDRRRICRERKTLVGERVEHVNRVKGLLFAQGVSDYEPLKRNRRARLEELKTGDGRPLPAHLKAQISRELDRLELVLPRLKAVEAERDALLKPVSEGVRNTCGDAGAAKGDGTGIYGNTLVRRAVPQLQQPKATGGLRWAGSDTLAERIGRSRTGGLQGRQSAAANDDDTARVAVAATPANLGAERLVRRARPEQRR